MTLKAAIFDWDGTITDSNTIKTEAFIELFKDSCPEAAEYIRAYQQNKGGISRFEKYRHYIRHFFHHEVSAAELDNFGQRYAKLCRDKLLQAPFIPGALETLQDLKQKNIPAFIVTGSPAEEIWSLAKARGISPLIKDIYGSPRSKDILLATVLQEHKLSPLETLFFGDAITDYNAAKINNIPFIGVSKDKKSSPFPPDTTIIDRISIRF